MFSTLTLLTFLSLSAGDIASACDKEIDYFNSNDNLKSIEVDGNIAVELMIIESGPGWQDVTKKEIDKCNIPAELRAWVNNKVAAELGSPRDDFEEPFQFVLYLSPEHVPEEYPEFTGVTAVIRVDGPDMSSSWHVDSIKSELRGSLSKK